MDGEIMTDYTSMLSREVTREILTTILVDGKWHKQILYVTDNFNIPMELTFCGVRNLGIKKTFRLTQKGVDCPHCKNMTLQDAIDKIENEMKIQTALDKQELNDKLLFDYQKLLIEWAKDKK